MRIPKTKRKKKVKAFSRFYSLKNLGNIYSSRIANKNSSGIDGIDLKRFEKDKDNQFTLIKKKVMKGKYKFTPYAEVQMTKGRGKPPRLLAIPTRRDQLVLSCLKEFLHANFEKAVNKRLPNSYIFDLNKSISGIDAKDKYSFIKTDITGFYDNIDREKLMNIVRRKVKCPEALKLIYRAITNPIVPRNSKRKQRYHYYSPKGIPQGLAISNILANIYMIDFDKKEYSFCFKYMRYVDDILVLCPSHLVKDILENLNFEVAKLGLELKDEKTEVGIIGKDSFDFLGYSLLKNSQISVKESSVQRLLASLSGKLVYADYHKDSFQELHKYLEPTVYKSVLIEDLNERITGAFTDKKRYGWLFYFSQINDLSLLHRLDRIVTKLCKRCESLERAKPGEVKSFVMAFRKIHEMRMKEEKKSDYIPSYDDFDLRSKRVFLYNRGLLDEDKTYTTEEISNIFLKTVIERMKRLELDIKGLS